MIARRLVHTIPTPLRHLHATNRDEIRHLAQGMRIMVQTGRWCSPTPELSTASRWNWVSQTWLYLVAEATPDGSWDWTAWSSNSTERSLHGVTADLAAAMAQAEQAAAAIGRVRMLLSA